MIAQVPTAQQIVPLVVEAPAANAGPATSYEYEPEEDEILARLLPRAQMRGESGGRTKGLGSVSALNMRYRSASSSARSSPGSASCASPSAR